MISSSIRDVVAIIKISLAAAAMAMFSFFLSIINVIPFLVSLTHVNSWYTRWASFFQGIWADYVFGLMGMFGTPPIHITFPDRLAKEDILALKSLFKSTLSVESLVPELLDSNEKAISLARQPRVIVTPNHQLFLDWIYIWELVGKMRLSAWLKIILKRSLTKLPVVGWGMKMLGFISVRRDWNKDQITIQKRLARLFGAKDDLPIALLIFPEGTTITDEMRSKSAEFALKHGLKPLQHVLMPRVTGLYYIINSMGDHFDGILDVTIGYGGLTPDVIPEDTLGFVSLMGYSKGPEAIHYHIRYYPLKTIPTSDRSEFASWLYKLYAEKDSLMEEFYERGRFPGVEAPPLQFANTRQVITSYCISTVFLASLCFLLVLLIFSIVNLF